MPNSPLRRSLLLIEPCQRWDLCECARESCVRNVPQMADRTRGPSEEGFIITFSFSIMSSTARAVRSPHSSLLLFPRDVGPVLFLTRSREDTKIFGKKKTPGSPILSLSSLLFPPSCPSRLRVSPSLSTRALLVFSREAAKTLRFFGGGGMHKYTHSFSLLTPISSLLPFASSRESLPFDEGANPSFEFERR